MKYSFLCANYRVELSNNPNKAHRLWMNAKESAQSFLAFAMYYEALPHIGTAFETSEIILSNTNKNKEQAIDLFTLSAIDLATTLNALSYWQRKEQVLQMTHQRLKREAKIHLVDVSKNLQRVFIRQMDTL